MIFYIEYIDPSENDIPNRKIRCTFDIDPVWDGTVALQDHISDLESKYGVCLDGSGDCDPMNPSFGYDVADIEPDGNEENTIVAITTSIRDRFAPNSKIEVEST